MFNDFKSLEDATHFEFGGFKQNKPPVVLYNGGGSGGGGGGGANGGGSADTGSDG